MKPITYELHVGITKCIQNQNISVRQIIKSTNHNRYLLNTSISWCFDFPSNKISSTSRDRAWPGHWSFTSENQPFCILFIVWSNLVWEKIINKWISLLFFKRFYCINTRNLKLLTIVGLNCNWLQVVSKICISYMYIV